jgi:Na+-transporting methylmalonyl-CoA/oxaloacetate decarboxylase gamma subunit
MFENFDISRFFDSLKYMWQGMLCIFVVIGVIILSVYLIGALSAKAEERKKAREEAAEAPENNN